MAHILLIEDTPSLQMVYETVLRAAGHRVTIAADARQGLGAFRGGDPALVLLDLMLPDGDGIELMSELLSLRPETPVVVITANGSINRAVAAMRAGAQDFLIKPFDEARLLGAIDNALARGALYHGPRAMPSAAGPAPATPGLPGGAPDAPNPAMAADLPSPPGAFIGSSPAMQAVYAKIASVARSMATVFVTGESGTGKELCAEAIHAASARANGPFVPLNCGAIPAELLESEVFGHLRGSFTGAISDKQGAAAAADGGTLFLDEICEMDLSLQTKLLRFLQTSTIQPVGATRPRKVNVRIICATNRDPMEAVRQGLFREDLYYRLHVVPIHMPALRERGGDVIEIAATMLIRLAREEGRGFRRLSPAVQAMFRSYPWPGNVRQLLNVLRNVVVLNQGESVDLAMLPPELSRPVAAPAPAYLAIAEAALPPPPGPGILDPANSPRSPLPAVPEAQLASDRAPEGTAESASDLEPPPAAPPGLAGLIGRPLAEIERLIIEETLAQCQGSVPKASRMLEVSPSTLYRKIEAWARRDDTG